MIIYLQREIIGAYFIGTSECDHVSCLDLGLSSIRFFLTYTNWLTLFEFPETGHNELVVQEPGENVLRTT